MAAISALPDVSDRFDAYKYARAQAMIIGYTSVWDRHTDLEVIAVEKLFRLPLINPETGGRSRTWDLGGKLDVTVRFGPTDPSYANRLTVIEHKSSAEDVEEGSTYRQRLMLDGQVSQYFEGGDQAVKEMGAGDEIDEIIYDISAKPRIRPYTATPKESRKYTEAKSRVCPECKKKNGAASAPHEIAIGTDDGETLVYCADGRIVTDPGGKLYANLREFDETPEEYSERCIKEISSNINDYYVQLEVVRHGVEREEYLWDLWQTGEMIREARRTNRFPKNPANCFQYNSPCEFWMVCTRQARLDNKSLFRIAEVENEELVNGA